MDNLNKLHQERGLWHFFLNNKQKIVHLHAQFSATLFLESMND